MKEHESGKDKVKKICDILRKETLEPARAEADHIIEEAKKQAEIIIKEAQQATLQMKTLATQEIESQKQIFQSSLNQAGKQALEGLRQKIEEKLFSHELGALLQKTTQNPQVIAQLISAVVHALEKEGINANLSAYVSSQVSVTEVNALLAKEILDRLKEKSVLLSGIGGGVEVKVHDQNITLDLSDKALRELLGNYVRKDFREIIFQGT